MDNYPEGASADQYEKWAGLDQLEKDDIDLATEKDYNSDVKNLIYKSAAELKHSLSKAVLYNVEWQTIRVSMLGTWVNDKTAEANVLHLQHYILEAYSVSDYEITRRLWRCINYYNAIRMGFHGMGLVGSNSDFLVTSHRDNLQEEYNRKMTEVGLGLWSWDEVYDDLDQLYVNELGTFKGILDNLVKRKDFATKKIGHLGFRSELVFFVDMMKDIIKEYE